ncbi:Re/Si-specific NAD(P)(+) transhydrogenase subunit alpha (plasmid) [Mesorhizobium sp. ORM8.1]
MKIGALKETYPGELRVAITPTSAVQLAKLGHQVFVETGAGVASGFGDADYEKAAATVTRSTAELTDTVDVVTKVRQPTDVELERMKTGQTLISFFFPAQNASLLKRGGEKGVTVVAMDMVPRISRAQKMDALSSMANIAGYRAVIEAANNFGRFFTGQVTAAGKVAPAKVLVIGAGVAGLAAIGTARGLGAIVRAFDVRPEVAEQIESMGGEFLLLDFSDSQDGGATGGYAAPSSPEFRAKQLELFLSQAPDVDVLITTALIPGRDAPKLWTAEMVGAMKPGSVVIDLAAERGGNCDLTVPDEKIVTGNNVTIIGYTDFPSRMGAQASELYANNIRHFVADLTPAKDGIIKHNMEDDVIRGATVTHGGATTFPPPPPKIAAIAAQKPKAKPQELTPEEQRAKEQANFRAQSRSQFALLGAGSVLMLIIGLYAPPSFIGHFIVFVLACFVGFQVIWNVSHSLHTPLMAVTNAISGIVILGALLQIGFSSWWVVGLSAVSVLIASINIVGGFLVTRRMLAMFQKS